MRRWGLMGVALLCAGVSGCGNGSADAQEPQQALVDRATIAVEEMLAPATGTDWRSMLQSAFGVMVCPRIFKAGFLIGGSGGDCVLLARDGGGGWSAPAFFAIGSGSVGFQAGVQDSEVIMIIRTRRGLDAILDSRFKFGANAGVTVATYGAGVEGATTAALRADIVAYSHARGLFAGIALDGSILSSDTGWDQAYYGSALGARQIVLQAQANNPGANPLRAMLSRFSGSTPPGGAASANQGSAAPSGYAPPQPAYGEPPGTAAARAGVNQQDLPPPGH